MDFNMFFYQYINNHFNTTQCKDNSEIIHFSKLVQSITDPLMDTKDYKLLGTVFEMLGSLEQSFLKFENRSRNGQDLSYSCMEPYWCFTFINMSCMYHYLNQDKTYSYHLAKINYYNQLEHLDILSKRKFKNDEVAHYCKTLYIPYYKELLGDTCLFYDHVMVKRHYREAKSLFDSVNSTEQNGMGNDYNFSGATSMLSRHLEYCGLIERYLDYFDAYKRIEQKINLSKAFNPHYVE
ncbi:hypothetical protein EDC19_1483 [Natranaerovirga hydrolytica]|uniref:Uncharacterized protein n=1 Tax=Natranaerovirga hydrolytica TaxID=680378 RepID=A0A4R1MN00_9FIRM|nr:hypothetical protein [Natranaerovirga hydrolytica]TCK93292.1 hypothetical protein EDC19_1483 [Natranaerovirga hydrolytica]